MPPFSPIAALCGLACLATQQGADFAPKVLILHVALCDGGSLVRLIPLEPQPGDDDPRPASSSCHASFSATRELRLAANPRRSAHA